MMTGFLKVPRWVALAGTLLDLRVWSGVLQNSSLVINITTFAGNLIYAVQFATDMQKMVGNFVAVAQLHFSCC